MLQLGCDVIAPSSMMDGRVAAIKLALKENGFGTKVIKSYLLQGPLGLHFYLT